MEEELKNTSIKILPSLWDKFKIACISERKTIYEKLEELITTYLNSVERRCKK